MLIAQGLHESYNGFFFRGSDIDRAVRDVVGKPVKVEHKGVDVGTVVSAWVDKGKLDLLLEIDPRVVEGALVAGLVKTGACRELSLGYSVRVTASAQGEDVAGEKQIQEVSLVRKGDRHKCHIHAFSTRKKG